MLSGLKVTGNRLVRPLIALGDYFGSLPFDDGQSKPTGGSLCLSDKKSEAEVPRPAEASREC